MKKFICNGCQVPCELAVRSCARPPRMCPFENTTHEIAWKETIEATNTPAKLTAEVFNRPDCPEWAKYAAVDKDGRGFYFSRMPVFTGDVWMGGCGSRSMLILGEFDSSDARHSVIERPATAAIPDWCKVGAWVWNDIFGYAKIIGFEYIDGKISIITSGAGALDITQARPARVRHWTFDEAEKHLGEVIRHKEYERHSMIIMAIQTDHVCSCWGNVTFDTMLYKYEFLDGSPCGVQEHLNDNGEWGR